MLLSDVKAEINAQVLTGENDESLGAVDIHNACGSDLMSDVLAFVKDQSLLLTGLVNPQVVRTAEMMDIIAICFVRGKTPPESLIECFIYIIYFIYIIICPNFSVCIICTKF